MARMRDVFREASFEAGGRTWKINRPNIKTERGMEGFLEERAVAFLRRQKLPEAYHAAALAKIADNAAAYQYVWGGPVFAKAIGTDEGFRKAMWLLVNQVDGQVISEEEFEQLYGEISEELLRCWNEINEPVPNSPSPPPEAGTTTTT